MHAEIVKVNQLKTVDRKKANFHVLRESSMPSILPENGYIDNGHDASLMKESSWLQKVAQRACKWFKRLIFNLKGKTT